MLRIAFLASNNGTSMQAVVGAIRQGGLAAEARLVVSNKEASNALAFARDHSIPTACIPTAVDPDAADRTLCDRLTGVEAELVVLSGYLRKLGPETLSAFEGRILNVHPALLPNHGGKGMYGRRVHEAVLAAGETETGASIHLVDADYDRGRVIATCKVPIAPNDTVADVEGRVMAAEKQLFVETVRQIAEGRLTLPL
jgi:phosphoribosylglycinamide formyltransferase-1